MPWFRHLTETQYRALKYINDNPNSTLFEASGFMRKQLKRITIRQARRIVSDFKIMDYIIGDREYLITDKGKRILNLEKMYQDKYEELL